MRIEGDPDALQGTASQLSGAASWIRENADLISSEADSIHLMAESAGWSERAAGETRVQALHLYALADSISTSAQTLSRLADRITDLQEQQIETRRLPGLANDDYGLSLISQQALHARSTAANEINALREGYVRPESLTIGDLLAKLTWFDIVTLVVPYGLAAKLGVGLVRGAGGLLRVAGGGKLVDRTTATYGAMARNAKLAATYFQVQATGKTVWIAKTLGVDGRGWLAEQAIFQSLIKSNPSLVKLPWNHRKVDLVDLSTNTVSSIKSIDPRLVTYANDSTAFQRQLTRYVDDVADWQPPRVVFQTAGGKIDRKLVDPHRELILAVPPTGLAVEHVAVLDRILKYANNKNVIFKIVEAK